MIDIPKLRALCDAATPGEWEAYSAPCCSDMGGVSVSGPGSSSVMQACVGRYGHPATLRDAEFIAAARTAVPALLAEVERLTKERDMWRRGGFDGIDALADKLGRVESQLATAERERDAFSRGQDALQRRLAEIGAQYDNLLRRAQDDAARMIANFIDALYGQGFGKPTRIAADIRAGAWRKDPTP